MIKPFESGCRRILQHRVVVTEYYYIDSGCKIVVTLWKTVSTQVSRRSRGYITNVYMCVNIYIHNIYTYSGQI